MIKFSDQFIQSLYLTGLLSLVVSFVFFYLIKHSTAEFFPILNIYSPKSPTKAKLLGGLGISAGIIVSLLALYPRINLMSNFEVLFVKAMVFSTLSITFYGYIDDRYETRARHKIIFQLISLSFLTFYAADLLASPSHKIPAIIITTVLGFLVINGTNLLDGLDTLSIKLGIMTSLGFMYLGHLTGSLLCIQLSVATIASLVSFYYYNRAPAKIYMGEIGSCLLGLVYTAQVVLCYSHLRSRTLGEDAISTILIPVTLPIAELGISFLRRIYFGKTPFSGDKLHFHYIFRAKTNYSVSKTTYIMSLGSLSIIAIGYLVLAKISPVVGFLTTVILYTGVYVGYCYNDWVKSYNEKHTVNILEHLSVGSVYLVDTSDLENIEVQFFIEKTPKQDQQKKAA